MKRLLIISLFFSSIHFNCFAQINDVHQLDQEMKNFRNRVHIYAKCLTGKCTKEERNAAAKAALKDGAIVAGTIALVGVTIGAGIAGRWLYTQKQKKDMLKRLEMTSGSGGVGSILLAVHDAIKVAFQVDQDKKLKVHASSGAHGPVINKQEEFPSWVECQTEVNYTISDHDTSIKLGRCGNQVEVNVGEVGTLTPVGIDVLLLTDLYKESKVYKYIVPFIKRLKSDHNIDRITIHISREDGNNMIIKDIEL